MQPDISAEWWRRGYLRLKKAPSHDATKVLQTYFRGKMTPNVEKIRHKSKDKKG